MLLKKLINSFHVFIKDCVPFTCDFESNLSHPHEFDVFRVFSARLHGCGRQQTIVVDCRVVFHGTEVEVFA